MVWTFIWGGPGQAKELKTGPTPLLRNRSTTEGNKLA